MFIASNFMGKFYTMGRYIGIRTGERHENIYLETMCLFRVLVFIQEIKQCDRLKSNLTIKGITFLLD